MVTFITFADSNNLSFLNPLDTIFTSDPINVILISDIFDQGSNNNHFYFSIVKKYTNKFKKIYYKHMYISDKIIESNKFGKFNAKLFDYLKKHVNSNDSLVVYTNACSDNMGSALKAMCLWFKYTFPELEITVNDTVMNADRERLEETFSNYTEKEFLDRLIEVF